MTMSEPEEFFPWEHVDAARSDASLQAEYPVHQAQKQFLQHARACPRCATPPQFLSWFFFSSPPSTWQHLCGRAGWMTCCDWCHCQVDFFLTYLN
jgi:hypothetical protein